MDRFIRWRGIRQAHHSKYEGLLNCAVDDLHSYTAWKSDIDGVGIDLSQWGLCHCQGKLHQLVGVLLVQLQYSEN